MAGQLWLLCVQRRFWELIAEGASTTDAADGAGVSRGTGERWFRTVGGVNPRIAQPQGLKKPRLSHDEREQIMIGTARGESIRSMARRLGRSASTIHREIKNNGTMREAPGRYRAKYRFEPPRHVRRLHLLGRMGSCQVVRRGGIRRSFVSG
ncbi:helix-turn-helix domain-containing protein, partial [Mycolicibacterium pallens]|uniref:helix-turn-helix domain-containing protein n=1 Tax=Mycolicibacterium pallens TaxID=370524 RepID=UPI0031D45621